MKMKMLLLVSLLSLVSCGIGDEKGPLSFSVQVEEPIRAEEVNFKALQTKVLPKCIGCHQDWTTEEVVNRFTRENLPEESRLFVTVKEGSMPKNSPPLSSELVEITRNYIANIRYKRPVENPLPVGLPVNFQDVQEKVFVVSCLPCHSARLATEEALKKSPWINREAPQESRLLHAVVSGKMPKGRNLLTENQKELLRRYLNGIQDTSP